jgi:hypothetical protein
LHLQPGACRTCEAEISAGFIEKHGISRLERDIMDIIEAALQGK